MSHIYLIRHGQASFGAENYDRLSPLGQQQAAVVGDYFAKQGTKIAQVVHGKMSRQEETASILAKQSGFSGELICHPGANEFDSDSLVKHYLPILTKQSTEFCEMLENNGKWWATGDSFELFFCAMVSLWQTDDNCPFESWNYFYARCLSCLNDVADISKQSEQKGITIIATSSGLISVVMQSILNFSNSTFMDMNLTTNNASISEIIWPTNKTEPEKRSLRKRNRLLSFNNITPLLLAQNSRLITRK